MDCDGIFPKLAEVICQKKSLAAQYSCVRAIRLAEPEQFGWGVTRWELLVDIPPASPQGWGKGSISEWVSMSE
jgi:hypothetical protein